MLETGESKIFVDETLLKKDFTDLKISEIKSINIFTDELYESLNISQSLMQLKVLNLVIYFSLVQNTVNPLILKLIMEMIKYFHIWVLMELEFQEFQQL